MVDLMVEMLKGLSGKRVTVSTESVVSGLLGGKKNPMKDKVVKVVTDSIVELTERGMYEKKRKEKDSTFELSNSKWGVRVGDSCILEHKGKYYVEMIYVKVGEVKYLYNGNEIKKEDIIGLKEYKKNESEKEGIVVRRMKVENVVSIQID